MRNILREIYNLTAAKKQIEDTLRRLWDEVEQRGITVLGGYMVEVKETPVRVIDPEKFRQEFGQDIFNAVAKVALVDALRHVPEVQLNASPCISITPRTTKRVICLKTSTGNSSHASAPVQGNSS